MKPWTPILVLGGAPFGPLARRRATQRITIALTTQQPADHPLAPFLSTTNLTLCSQGGLIHMSQLRERCQSPSFSPGGCTRTARSARAGSWAGAPRSPPRRASQCRSPSRGARSSWTVSARTQSQRDARADATTATTDLVHELVAEEQDEEEREREVAARGGSARARL